MSASQIFRNFDDAGVYASILRREALEPHARNFVVEYGPAGSKIACDLSVNAFEDLIQSSAPRDTGRPVRWINIWGPNHQGDIIDTIADQYEFSRRLRAILKKAPPRNMPSTTATPSQTQEYFEPVKAKAIPKHDPELGNGAIEMVPPMKIPEGFEGVNHFRIASHLINYQSFDLGEKFICVGANWMHHTERAAKQEGDGPEKIEKRMWSWLVLCDDSTVISLHEDYMPSSTEAQQIGDIRKHTLHILSQISVHGISNEGSVSLISIRPPQRDDNSVVELGPEMASNLFYYLFDNWYGTYLLIINTQQRLERLSKEILAGIGRKHQRSSNEEIIPELYKIGRDLRRSKHLYEGYHNIVERILRLKSTSMTLSGLITPGGAGKRVAVELAASERFERLGDRIKLIVLSSINEAIGEKDALLNTYFNITAQKDSAATAKLSRNATLLSKLGVLFLPVSLMTSYFSVQIKDLEGVYSSQTYWVCFAAVIVISFIALFFLSRVLYSVTESLEARSKSIAKFFQKRLGVRGEKEEEDI